MAEKVFKGRVKAKIIEVRFATSGKIISLLKKRGDKVKKGELLASLDKKIFQNELEQELADYEKVRAEFEIFNLQKGEPQDDLTKYLKVQKQSQLNASVKEVELAKARLDQADLFSPIEGIIIDDSNLVAGIYITPASSPIKILDSTFYYFELEIQQTDLPEFLNSRPMAARIPGVEKIFSGHSRSIVPSEKGLWVEVEFSETSGLIFGLEGEASLEGF